MHKHHMGRPQKELRAHYNGMPWMARWEDLPEQYGPCQTVNSCFCRWRDGGTLERAFQAIHPEAAGELSIDATSVKVHEQPGRGSRNRRRQATGASGGRAAAGTQRYAR